MIREGGTFGFTTNLDDLGEEWAGLIKERAGMTLIGVMFLEFGFAEESIALIELRDAGAKEHFLVGVGESLRGYIAKYEGPERYVASHIFLTQIINRTTDRDDE